MKRIRMDLRHVMTILGERRKVARLRSLGPSSARADSKIQANYGNHLVKVVQETHLSAQKVPSTKVMISEAKVRVIPK